MNHPYIAQVSIPFVARLDADETSAWLAALSQAMPSERVIPFEALSEHERACVEVAIVGDPDVRELKLLPRLKWVQSVWAGVDGLIGGLRNGVSIVRLNDPQLSRTMAEAVLAWTLYLHRDMPAYARQQASVSWRPRAYREPGDTVVTLLGLGALGGAAAGALAHAGFRVRGWSRSYRTAAGIASFHGHEGLRQACTDADIVVCLLPLTSETRGLIDAQTLRWLPQGASLINFGRGGVVDTPALLDALDLGHLAHAVLDVFEEEPLPATSPLWLHPRVTVLPHIAAPTNRASAASIVARNISAWRTGGCVPPEVDRRRGY